MLDFKFLCENNTIAPTATINSTLDAEMIVATRARMYCGAKKLGRVLPRHNYV